jgi:hypothetical protein
MMFKYSYYVLNCSLYIKYNIVTYFSYILYFVQYNIILESVSDASYIAWRGLYTNFFF